MMAEKSVGDYQLLEPIGVGGLGEVFRARDTREGRTVALKLLPVEFAGDPDRSTRFLEEAHVASALSHPAIAALYEVGEADGQLFLAFEYVAGPTVRAMLAQGAINPKQAVSIVLQVADALADAHAAGIIHRDIRPENIVVTPKGAVKVLEFGLSNWTRGGLARQQAATQEDAAPAAILESLAYMSPEQALEQTVDAHTDIYSLGVVFYHMLTGTNPFAASTPGATLIAILKETPRKPSEVNQNVPAVLDPIVMKMISRDVQARYASAAVVASDLREAYGERTEHVLEPDVPEAAGPPRRRWLWPAAAVVVLAALALGGYTERREVQRIWRQWFGKPPAPILALIPLTEADQDRSAFADGLTDDLAMRLGQTPGLRVLGRAATRGYRGRTPAEVAAQTGAAAILTGRIQRDAGDLKINLELIDPSDGVQVWRQEFVNQPANVLAAQTVIADEVARALRVGTAPTELHERTMARSVSPDAYDLYAQARDARAGGNLDAAVDLFEKATRQDDGFAEAHAALAEALHARASLRSGRDDPEQPRVRAAAASAAAIEPDLAAVDVMQALAAPSYRETLGHLVRAARHDPSSAEAFHQIGDQLIHVDTPRAVRMYEQARSLDPGRFDNYAELVITKAALGNTREAASEVDALLRALPGEPRAPLLKAWATSATDSRALVSELQRAATRGDLPPAGHVVLAQFLADAGRQPEALGVLQGLEKRGAMTCEASALLSGLSSAAEQQVAPAGGRTPAAGRRGPATGRQGPATGQPQSTPPIAADVPARCAAATTAAMADAAGTGAALQRIAREEPALRSWIEKRYGMTGARGLAMPLYPWRAIAAAPEVVAARGEIRTALAALKKIADEELKGLP